MNFHYSLAIELINALASLMEVSISLISEFTSASTETNSVCSDAIALALRLCFKNKNRWSPFLNRSVPGSGFQVQQLQLIETVNYIDQDPEYLLSPIG